jgi:hypothetical protein
MAPCLAELLEISALVRGAYGGGLLCATRRECSPVRLSTVGKLGATLPDMMRSVTEEQLPAEGYRTAPDAVSAGLSHVHTT